MAHAVMHGRTARPVPFWTGYIHTRATLVAVVSIAYGAALLLNIVTLLTPPRLSLVLAIPAAGRARVTWVLPGSRLWEDGVRQGDRVLTLDGRVPTLRDAGVWTGERLLVRTGMGTTTAVDAGKIRSGRTTWPLLVLSPWFILLGTLMVLRARQPSVGRATYALFASAAFALALAPAADADQPIPTVVEFAMVALFAACFVRFFLTFPTSRGSARVRTLLLAPPLAGIMLGLAALLWPDLYEPAYLLRMAVLLCYLLGGIGLLVFSFVTAHERNTRRGLTIISTGTVASILPFVALFLAPTVLHRPPPMSAEQAILALALLPASFAYAILRHNVLNVHLLQRWLVHGVLWGALLALYVAVVYARNGLPGVVLPEPGHSVALATMLVLLAGGTL